MRVSLSVFHLLSTLHNIFKAHMYTHEEEIKKKWIIEGYMMRKIYIFKWKSHIQDYLSAFQWFHYHHEMDSNAELLFGSNQNASQKIYECCFVLSKHYFRSLSINAGMHNADDSNSRYKELKKSMMWEERERECESKMQSISICK